jgi:ABC-type Zn uptake system ZnuABC Zn-binding protein ZnuA
VGRPGAQEIIAGFRFWLPLVAFLAVGAAAAAGPLQVVAATPDLASLARLVLGEEAAVRAIVPPGADPESFEPKPGDLARLRAADLVLRVGLDFDPWLDAALIRWGREPVQRGGPGYVDASIGIPLLEVKGRSPTAQAGHAHGLANPHYWLDPANAEIITAAIVEGLLRVDRARGLAAIAVRDRFLAELQARTTDWRARLAPAAGACAVAYHDTWPYFARAFRLNIIGFIEPKPGVPPGPGHLAWLIGAMRDAGCRLVLHEPFEPLDTAELVARRAGAVVVRLAPSVGSMPAAVDYLALIDGNVAAIAGALAAPAR